MVELKQASEGMMHQSYAGDVYNAAVYLKRCFPQVSVNLVTVVGQDNLSKNMTIKCQEEAIETDFIFKHSSKAPGMYLIENDDNGERYFTYWRNDSAARKVVDFLSDDVLLALSKADYFFFSGISIAVVEADKRNELFSKLKQLKAAGVKIVFDPNYRAKLWTTKEETMSFYDKAFDVADIVLPGIEDLEALYGVTNVDATLNLLAQYTFDEVIVKNGAGTVVTQDGKSLTEHPITPVTNVVDTTSAGDAFDGVYLGARLSGESISQSVKAAAKAAGTVIQFPGAIAPKTAFLKEMAAD